MIAHRVASARWRTPGIGVALALVAALLAGVQALLMGHAGLDVAFLAVGALAGCLVGRGRTPRAETLRCYDASPDLLATVEPSGRLVRVNGAWERTLGYSREATRGCGLIELVHSEERAATRAQMRAVAEGLRESVAFRNRVRTVGGTYRWLEWSACADPSAGTMHAVARDVTLQHRAQRQLVGRTSRLEATVAERTCELDDARAETLQLLAVAVEYHDDETFEHTERVGAVAAQIAVQLGLRAEQVGRIRRAAPLHDVGKIAIPDRILRKRGPLTATQQRVMETHAGLGARLLSRGSSPVLQMAAVIAATHHERWDGSGYPSGLAGERIPLVGRVVAVADVFDVLTHARPYKPAWPARQALAMIEHASGSQFDPSVVAAFLALQRDTETAGGERRQRLNGAETTPARAYVAR